MGKGKPSSNKKSHYVYTLNLKGGKKYVGYTSNLNKRMHQHFSGNGAMVTKQCPPVSVHAVNKCSSLQAAKNAERIVYHNMKNYHGTDKVRGAGHTKRFDDVEDMEEVEEEDEDDDVDDFDESGGVESEDEDGYPLDDDEDGGSYASDGCDDCYDYDD